ncbi:MAG: hypothetical protein JWN86_3572 [Planctomycetota bacterium]|nr:hypothetical protein [Planctomycetota bacterium]
MFRSESRVRVTLFELMALTAGMAIGLWLIVPQLRKGPTAGSPNVVMGLLAFSLGGLSLAGPPLLLWERRRSRRTWGAGRVMWFSQGMASWLLWPPIVYSRARGGDLPGMATGCYMYGTPLMAIYMTAALVCGGWLRKRRRRARRHSWRERFGLGLALVWACFGLYILSIFYREDFRR